MNLIDRSAYSKIRMAARAAFVEAQDALVFDVRLKARARVLEQNRAPLMRLLGEPYRHVGAFGNSNYKGALGENAGIALAAPEVGSATVLPWLADHSIILLSACRGVESGHRELVAAQTGAPIVQLQPSDLPPTPSPSPVSCQALLL